MKNAMKVAIRFSSIVRAEFSHDELREINKRNKTARYVNACATQDFCDANMLMAEAFESVMGHEVDGNSDSDCDVWNQAWDIAKLSGFSVC
jgi:hypothetical protein